MRSSASGAFRCRTIPAGPQHAEHRHHSRRPRAQCDSGSRLGGNFHPPGGFGRSASAPRSRKRSRAWRRRARCLCIPALHLGAVDGFETTVVAYTTDIPAFGGAWGQPFLFGPGTIHVAHTDEERVPKAELLEAVEIYKKW